MSHLLSDYTYYLPPELIAHSPLPDRAASRLLVVDRQTKTLTHTTFSHLAEFIDDSWIIARNNTKVVPARIYAKKSTGGAVELLLSKKIVGSATHPTWECLTRPGVKTGQVLVFPDTSVEAVVEEAKPTEYTRKITFSCPDSEFFPFLEQVGSTPLPPYIHASVAEEKLWKERYQTLYAKNPGSVAAPTAGLHMTADVEQALRSKGIEILDCTLHVGLGTFLPVKTDDIRQHHMHGEQFSIDAATAKALTLAKTNGKKILALGTTTTRVLETLGQNQAPEIAPQSGETQIFIYPPYQFALTHGLITNFHLPESTLLMLVSAFCSAPQTSDTFTTFANSLLGKVYQEAIARQYRFFSFGDAVLIL